jgi:hypothetical protein
MATNNETLIVDRTDGEFMDDLLIELHCDSANIQDLAESLVRSMESNRDVHNIYQPDLTLAKVLASAIGEWNKKIETQV